MSATPGVMDRLRKLGRLRLINPVPGREVGILAGRGGQRPFVRGQPVLARHEFQGVARHVVNNI